MPEPRTLGGEDIRWQALITAQVTEHGRLCFRLANRILGDARAAEDVCQQAFMRAWQQREHIRDAGALRAWLLRTIVNESLTLLRRAKIERRALGQRDAGPAGPLPADQQMALSESVLLALEQLPEATREVIVLRLMDGHSGNEVSRMLNCSASEVSRRLHEGMDRLRVLLGEWSGGGGIAGARRGDA